MHVVLLQRVSTVIVNQARVIVDAVRSVTIPPTDGAVVAPARIYETTLQLGVSSVTRHLGVLLSQRLTATAMKIHAVKHATDSGLVLKVRCVTMVTVSPSFVLIDTCMHIMVVYSTFKWVT